jgi:hypothetical protein
MKKTILIGLPLLLVLIADWDISLQQRNMKHRKVLGADEVGAHSLLLAGGAPENLESVLPSIIGRRRVRGDSSHDDEQTPSGKLAT